MPKDEKGKARPLSTEESSRLKGSAAELASAEKAKAQKAEEAKLKSVGDVKAKKVLARDKKSGRIKLGVDTTRVAGQEAETEPVQEMSDKAKKYELPKVQLPGPVISTGKTLARTGMRAPKRGELARGVTIVDPAPKRAKKTRSKTVVRDAETGRAKTRTPEDFKRTEVAPVAPAPERSRPSLAPGAGPLRENVYVNESKPTGEKATRRLKGLAVPHKVIAPAVNQAIQHIDGMATTKGSPEYHSHVEAFNAIHPTILGMDTTIHHALGAMAHHTMYPQHNSSSVITQIKSAIGDRLSEGKKMETQRAQRQGTN